MWNNFLELSWKSGGTFVPSLPRLVKDEYKNLLKDLNNRFATYIERVRYLEQQNKLLDAQLRQITVRKNLFKILNISELIGPYLNNL